MLKPAYITRTLENGFKVYSFYPYDEIAPLIKTKHTHIGAAVYRIMASASFGWFVREFSFAKSVGVVPIDDRPLWGYSHTAILAKALQTKKLKPLYGTLHARNQVSYAGKSLAFRQEHPRGFYYENRGYHEVILVDDLITTGTTILEAKEAIEKAGAVPLFALTLADAREV